MKDSTDFKHLVLFTGGWQGGGGGGVLEKIGSFLTTMRAFLSDTESKSSKLERKECEGQEYKKSEEDINRRYNKFMLLTWDILTDFQFVKTENHVSWTPCYC